VGSMGGAHGRGALEYDYSRPLNHWLGGGM
jgi:hypothetical protein